MIAVVEIAAAADVAAAAAVAADVAVGDAVDDAARDPCSLRAHYLLDYRYHFCPLRRSYALDDNTVLHPW